MCVIITEYNCIEVLHEVWVTADVAILGEGHHNKLIVKIRNQMFDIKNIDFMPSGSWEMKL